MRYQNYEYLTLEQWEALFWDLNLELIAGLTYEDDESMSESNDYNNRMISQRATELITRHPEQRAVFEGYVRSQQMECDDLVVGVTWLLKRL